MAPRIFQQTSKLLKLIYFNSSSPVFSGNKFCANVSDHVFHCRTISSSLRCATNIDEEKKEPRKKTARIPKITLYFPNDTMIVTHMENAEKLAKRRNLQLIQVTELDKKTDRPVYKLMSGPEYIGKHIERESTTESNSEKSVLKSVKLFSVQSKISKHDLLVKIKTINKLLSKNHLIKVIVTHCDNNGEFVNKLLKQEINGAFKRTDKSNSTVFEIEPYISKQATTE